MSATGKPPSLPVRLAAHAGVYALAATMLLPFLWMVLTSLKTNQDAADVSFFPRSLEWSNYADAVRSAELDRFYLNSIIVAVVTTVLSVLHNALAGFVFAKLRFAGRAPLFWIVLSTMMLPAQVSFMFAYAITGRLGFVDNLQALIIPFLASGFGIFYMKQAISAVPDSLLEAARIDGMTDLDLLWSVVRPAVWPAICALAIFTFVFSWNNFFWPLIVIDSMQHKTLPLALADLSAGQYVQSRPVQMAAATILTLPLIVIFFFTQRAFVRGITLTGMKE